MLTDTSPRSGRTDLQPVCSSQDLGALDDSMSSTPPLQVQVIPTPELTRRAAYPPTPGWLPIKTRVPPLVSPRRLEPPEKDLWDHVATVCPSIGPKLGM